MYTFKCFHCINFAIAADVKCYVSLKVLNVDSVVF